MNLHLWANITEEVLNPTLTRKMISGEQMTLAQIRIRKGGIVAWHQHPNEQISTLVEGRAIFRIGEEEQTLSPGGSVIIPPNVPHSVEALEDVFAWDVFSPPRKDWITGTDTYLRK